MKAFSIIDTIIVSTYFILVLMISLLVIRKRQENGYDYFYASGRMGWITLGLSLFISHISAAHFVGFINNIWSPLFIEWLSIPIILALGWLAAPLYIKLKLKTVPEIFEHLYNSAIRKFVSGISIIFYILIRISITLFAGSILLSKFFNWNTSAIISVILILTGFYVVVSGFRGIVYTQVFQAAIVIIGVISFIIFGLYGVHDASVVNQQVLSESQFLLKPWSLSGIPITGVIIGAPIVLIWYWAVDQYMVQRILSAKSPERAGRASIFAGFLVFIFSILILFFCFVIKTQYLGASPAADFINQSLMLLQSPGFKGLLFVIIVSLMMSSLAAAINSASALYVYDFYKPRNPQASERKEVLLGRLISMGIVIISIFSFPLLNTLDAVYYQKILVLPVYIAPPVVVLFFAGIFSKKLTAAAASWTIYIAGILILFKLSFDFQWLAMFDSQPLNLIFKTHYMNFTVIIFVVSIITLTGISLFTKGSINNKIIDNYIKKMFRQSDIDSGKSKPIKLHAVLSAFLIVITIGLWMVFS